MSSCIACGTELEPPARAPHTVYVKTLYRIAGQDYCRHHITKAAVAAGLITEVRAGSGPGTGALSVGASAVCQNRAMWMMWYIYRQTCQAPPSNGTHLVSASGLTWRKMSVSV